MFAQKNVCQIFLEINDFDSKSMTNGQKPMDIPDFHETLPTRVIFKVLPTYITPKLYMFNIYNF